MASITFKAQNRVQFPHGIRPRVLQLILDSVPQGVIVLDQAERVVFANERYFEMYGVRKTGQKTGIGLGSLLIASLVDQLGCVSDYMDCVRRAAGAVEQVFRL